MRARPRRTYSTAPSARQANEFPPDEKVYEDITFSKAEDSDIKRENANIRWPTRNHLLKYRQRQARKINEMFVLNSDTTKAHYIHIHDADDDMHQIDLLKTQKRI